MVIDGHDRGIDTSTGTFHFRKRKLIISTRFANFNAKMLLDRCQDVIRAT
jgi:hypothetical protein